MRKAIASLVTCLVALSAAANVMIQSDPTDWVSLTNAIAHAPADATILMSTGVYNEVQTITSLVVTIDGRYNQNCDAKVPGGSTTLDGSSLLWSKGSVFTIKDSTVRLIDLNITRGGPIFLGPSLLHGGGLNISGSIVTMLNCRVYNNTCLGHGGGLYLVSSEVTLTDTPVYTNFARNGSSILSTIPGSGGGIYVSDGRLSASGESEIGGNFANAAGGGVYVSDGRAFFRDHAALLSNQASNGGGFYAVSSLMNVGQNADIMGNTATNHGGGGYLNNSTGVFFSANTYIGSSSYPNRCLEGNGGGIYARQSQLSFEDTPLSLNTASNRGGGLYLEQSFCLLDGAHIGDAWSASRNEALSGGGIYSVNSTLVLTNDALVCNSFAYEKGGGIYATISDVSLYPGSIIGHLRTNRGNVAVEMGGGMYALSSTTHVYGASVLNNTSMGDGGGVYIWSSFLSASNAQISGNWAGLGGGGLNVGGGLYGYSSAGELADTVVASNQASRGAGIYWAGIDGSLFLSDNCRLNANTARDQGGGLCLAYYAGAEIVQAQICNNVSSNLGGGVYANYASVDAYDSVIAANHAETRGGGMCLENETYAGVNATERPMLVQSNSASAGGGVWVGSNCTFAAYAFDSQPFTIGGNSARAEGGGVAVSNGSFSAVGDVRISANTAGLDGGGLHAQAASQLAFAMAGAGAWIHANSASNGGGLCARDADTFCQLYGVLLGGDTPAEGNYAGANGGGAALFDGAMLDAVSIKVRHNRSNLNGGGVYAYRSRVDVNSDAMSIANPMLPDTWFTHNRATNDSIYANGGALALYGGTAYVSRAYISENRATRGGGIYASIHTDVELVNSLIISNSAFSSLGGGLRVWGDGTRCALLHCDILDNTDSGVMTDSSGTPPTVSLTNCIVGPHSGGTISAGHDVGYSDVAGSYSGPFNIALNPLFFNQGSNDLRLKYHSPCIAAGATVTQITEDVTGSTRPIGLYDIGAYEYNGATYDTDGDLMVDEWELIHTLNPTNPADATVDTDGDTDLNLTEYIADTDPRDSNDFFRVYAINNNTAGRHVVIKSSAQRMYDLERSVTPLGEWLAIEGQTDLPGTGAVMLLHDTNAPSQWNCYRARVRLP